MKLVVYDTDWVRIVDADGLVLQQQDISCHNTE